MSKSSISLNINEYELLRPLESMRDSTSSSLLYSSDNSSKRS